jgi:SAM-dependent methyltransferase
VHAPGSPTHCAWCGATLQEADRLPGGLRCTRCGARTIDPWPADAELDAAYAGWYRPASGRFSGPLDGLLRRSRAQLAARVDELAPPGPVLDVGSGDGALLDALHAAGRSALGLERASVRPDVREAEVTELDDRFAAVVFWHSLEHLREPGRALAHAATLLQPGGVLVIAVPNVSSLQSHWFGERWLALDLPRHLVHLPARTLLRGAHDAGLTVERVSFWRGGQVLFGMLHGLVGLLPGQPNLYDAIRRADARSAPLGLGQRLGTLAAGAALAPVAGVLSSLEVALKRGGSTYLELRRE